MAGPSRAAQWFDDPQVLNPLAEQLSCDDASALCFTSFDMFKRCDDVGLVRRCHLDNGWVNVHLADFMFEGIDYDPGRMGHYYQVKYYYDSPYSRGLALQGDKMHVHPTARSAIRAVLDRFAHPETFHFQSIGRLALVRRVSLDDLYIQYDGQNDVSFDRVDEWVADPRCLVLSNNLLEKDSHNQPRMMYASSWASEAKEGQHWIQRLNEFRRKWPLWEVKDKVELREFRMSDLRGYRPWVA